MPISELTEEKLVQQCVKCNVKNTIPLAQIHAGIAHSDGVDLNVVRLPPCAECGTVEFILRSPDAAPAHTAPGSWGHRHRMLVDHLHAELVERGQVPDGFVAPGMVDGGARGARSAGKLDDEAVQQWFPNGLKLEFST